MITVLITSIGCAPASVIARTLMKSGTYRVIGIDIQNECVGNFITNEYIKCPRVDAQDYWSFITGLISSKKIECVFVTNNIETLPWSRMKELLPCRVFINDPSIVEMADDKLKTLEWCIKNSVRIPETVDVRFRPCIVKPTSGSGSNGLIIARSESDRVETTPNTIIQRFIDGDEYTVDVISDLYGRVVNVVPKHRLLVKHGQSYKSTVCMDEDIIKFVTDICNKLESKYVVNIQLIRERSTGQLYLIEINPRWATTVSLSIAAGVNMPMMLIENDYTVCPVSDKLMLIRDTTEFFMTK